MSRGGGLTELFEVLRNRWKLVVGVTLGVVVGAGIYVYSLPTEYDAEAIVAISPRPTVPGSSSDFVRILGPKYVSYISARSTVDQVAATLGEDPDTLADALNADLARDTGTVTIVARRQVPSVAARDANAFADKLVEFGRLDKLMTAQLVAPALPPTQPAAPQRKLLMAAALVLGLLLATGVAVLLERGRPRVRSWREMAALTGYPVLGRIPSSRAIRSRPNTAFSDPVVGASFRTLRANLEPILRERGVKLVVVTSPAATDGKTTVAALLAESFSRLGAKTLLVDADLRRPRVSEVASLERRSGLAGLLRGGTSFASSLQPGWLDNLYVLPTTQDSDAGDLLARSFADLAPEMTNAFDYVVVDTPPLLGTDDTRSIVSTANGHGVLLVVAAGSPSQPVHEAVLAMEALKAPVLGIVGNRVKDAPAYSYADS